MTLIAGVDIGNATTEVALAEVPAGAAPRFLATATIPTTGIKGTPQNTQGVFQGLTVALERAGRELGELDLIRINEAAPVIGDVAMETISETIITESTMIGHNPSTPGGLGVAVGTTIRIEDLGLARAGEQYIVLADRTHDFRDVARRINEHAERVTVTGAILQLDDGVLVDNRLERRMPIVDEVRLIDRVPTGMPAAIEVAEAGRVIETLSNPYGIATLFGLSASETAAVVPMARALVGNRSAVVIKTPAGDVTERRIPAGTLHLLGERAVDVDVEAGAEEISEDDMLAAMAFGQEAIAAFCAEQKAFLAKVEAQDGPIATREYLLDGPSEEVHDRVFAHFGEMEAAISHADKSSRIGRVEALKEAIAAEFSDEEQLQWERTIPAELKGLEKRAMRKMVVERGERVDGRSATEIRPLMVKPNYLPLVHGSGLFQRGQTQVLSVATLGMLNEWQRLDTIELPPSLQLPALLYRRDRPHGCAQASRDRPW